MQHSWVYTKLLNGDKEEFVVYCSDCKKRDYRLPDETTAKKRVLELKTLEKGRSSVFKRYPKTGIGRRKRNTKQLKDNISKAIRMMQKI